MALFAGSVPLAMAQEGGDAAKGEVVFKKCATCHKIGDNATNSVGPVLTGVVGRQTGTYTGYSYSTLNKAAGEAGLHWTEENIFAYLPNPNAFLKKYLTDNGHADEAKGVTKMPFNLNSEQERKDVIAYLKTFSKK
jgi:cytochrome c